MFFSLSNSLALAHSVVSSLSLAYSFVRLRSLILARRAPSKPSRARSQKSGRTRPIFAPSRFV